MNNNIYHKVYDEITYSFQTSMVAPLKFENVLLISSHTLLGMWLVIHAGIKVNIC